MSGTTSNGHGSAEQVNVDHGLGPFTTIGRNGPRFSAAKLARYLETDTPFARGSNGHLYFFEDGVYRPDGEGHARDRIAKLMGDGWLPRYPSETVTLLKDGAPKVLDQPPTDRLRVSNGDLLLTQTKRGLRWRLVDADPAIRTLVTIPVSYDPTARARRFERALELIFKEAPDLIQATHEIYGYSLTPDNGQQKAFMAIGRGGNGKTFWLRMLRRLLGSANCTSMTLNYLNENRFATDQLYGKLANICTEISAEELREAHVFKAITGGDAISAEKKFGAVYDFTPFVRLFFAANHAPASRDNTVAYFDRWIILPFRSRIRGTRREREAYWQELGADDREMSGILNLALDGLKQFRSRGKLYLPAECSDELDKYREQSDSVTAFLNDDDQEWHDPIPPHTWRGTPLPVDAWRAGKFLYLQYVHWCDEVRRQPLGKKGFNERLRDQRGISEVKRGGKLGWKRMK